MFLVDRHLKAAAEIWRELAPELRRNNLLDRLDRFTFAMYCVHLADWIEATKDIARNGSWRSVRTVSGDEMPRLSPAVKVREMAEKHILEIGARFGLDPSNRYKLLRDQAVAPLGGLFDAERASAPAEAKPEPEGPQNPVGLMRQLGGRPPGTRPN